MIEASQIFAELASYTSHRTMLLLSRSCSVAYYLQINEIARLSNSQDDAYLMRILILFKTWHPVFSGAAAGSTKSRLPRIG